MRVCQYIYCGRPYKEELTECPVCGYPVNAARLKEEGFVHQILPGLPVDRVIDMHQIIPNKEGMLARQLQMMEKIGIEKVLLQSVPSKVTSTVTESVVVRFVIVNSE